MDQLSLEDSVRSQWMEDWAHHVQETMGDLVKFIC